MTDTDRMVLWLRKTLDAAERDAEAATAATGGPHWRGSDSGLYSNDASNHPGPFLADAYGYTDPRIVAHATRHDPAAVLHRIAADRKLLDDLLAEPHAVLTPGGSTQIYCDADSNLNEFCDCGRDARVERQLRLLAEGWGWTEETT